MRLNLDILEEISFNEEAEDFSAPLEMQVVIFSEKPKKKNIKYKKEYIIKKSKHLFEFENTCDKWDLWEKELEKYSFLDSERIIGEYQKETSKESLKDIIKVLEEIGKNEKHHKLGLSLSIDGISSAVQDFYDRSSDYCTQEYLYNCCKSIFASIKYLPVFEGKKCLKFYIDRETGCLGSVYKKDKENTLTFVIKEDSEIEYSCLRDRIDQAIHTGNIDIGSVSNAREIETIFKILYL